MTENSNIEKGKVRKWLFLFLGMAFLVLSYFGIIMPGVPAIPFILLAAWFFLQSSERLFQWMSRQRFIGPVIKKYFTEGQVSAGARWFVISQLWVSLIIAQLIFISTLPGYIGINAGGIVFSVLLYRLIR